mmetsp:Transcript_150472/g.483644  ORF Transcript_150472/g.483644 Transcript_150472/m.483644 type:complete len:279 (-) Transcript_150472:4338-5174(-)
MLREAAKKRFLSCITSGPSTSVQTPVSLHFRTNLKPRATAPKSTARPGCTARTSGSSSSKSNLRKESSKARGKAFTTRSPGSNSKVYLRSCGIESWLGCDERSVWPPPVELISGSACVSKATPRRRRACSSFGPGLNNGPLSTKACATPPAEVTDQPAFSKAGSGTWSTAPGFRTMPKLRSSAPRPLSDRHIAVCPCSEGGTSSTLRHCCVAFRSSKVGSNSSNTQPEGLMLNEVQMQMGCAGAREPPWLGLAAVLEEEEAAPLSRTSLPRDCQSGTA